MFRQLVVLLCMIFLVAGIHETEVSQQDAQNCLVCFHVAPAEGAC